MKQLTAKFVRNVTEPGWYYDGDAGLFLLVGQGKRGATKSYVQRLTVAGTRRDIGLGPTRWLTLTEARATAEANRKIARMGGDPRAKRSTVPTFADALEKVLEVQRTTMMPSRRSWRRALRPRTHGSSLTTPGECARRRALAVVFRAFGDAWENRAC